MFSFSFLQEFSRLVSLPHRSNIIRSLQVTTVSSGKEIHVSIIIRRRMKDDEELLRDSDGRGRKADRQRERRAEIIRGSTRAY